MSLLKSIPSTVWSILTTIGGLFVVGNANRLLSTTSSGGAVMRTIGTGLTIDSTSLSVSSTIIGGTTASSSALGVFTGMGDAGNVTFDGTTSVTGFSLASRVYTATSAGTYSYKDITIATSGGDVTIAPKGCVLLGRTLTITGSNTARISTSGSNASGGTGGAGAAVLANAPLQGGVDGANGRTTSLSGIGGTGLTSGVCLGLDGLTGGSCKDTTTTKTQGTAGNCTRNYSTNPSLYDPLSSIILNAVCGINTTTSRTHYPLYGAAGTGGSALQLGVGGTGTTGGTGGTGGVQICRFGTVATGSAYLIFDSSGGDGATTTVSTNGAGTGGNGGNGGGALILCSDITGSNAIQVDCSGGDGQPGVIVGTGVWASGGTGGQGGWGAMVYSSATVTPTVNVNAGSNGTNVGAGYPTLPTPANGTGVVCLLS